MVFRLGTEGRYSLTNACGKMFCSFFVCFVRGADILSQKLTSERVLSIRLSGLSLWCNLCLNKVIFSPNVVFEEFFLRGLKTSPLIRSVLESFCRFEVRAHAKKELFFFSNFSPLYTRVQKSVLDV